jgi:hypothetical protein
MNQEHQGTQRWVDQASERSHHLNNRHLRWQLSRLAGTIWDREGRNDMPSDGADAPGPRTAAAPKLAPAAHGDSLSLAPWR